MSYAKIPLPHGPSFRLLHPILQTFASHPPALRVPLLPPLPSPRLPLSLLSSLLPPPPFPLLSSSPISPCPPLFSPVIGSQSRGRPSPDSLLPSSEGLPGGRKDDCCHSPAACAVMRGEGSMAQTQPLYAFLAGAAFPSLHSVSRRSSLPAFVCLLSHI